jgi:hypothetical protein
MLFRNPIETQIARPGIALCVPGFLKTFQRGRIMQSTQPILQYEVTLQMKRNERKAEERKLELLKERLQATTKQLQSVRAA